MLPTVLEHDVVRLGRGRAAKSAEPLLLQQQLPQAAPVPARLQERGEDLAGGRGEALAPVAATGAFTSSSSITATQQIESDLRVQAPLLRCDPAASVLTVTGGTQGVLVDDTLQVNGVIAPEASLPFLSLSSPCGSKSPWCPTAPRG